MDPGRKTESKFRLEPGFKNQIYGPGSVSDCQKNLW